MSGAVEQHRTIKWSTIYILDDTLRLAAEIDCIFSDEI